VFDCGCRLLDASTVPPLLKRVAELDGGRKRKTHVATLNATKFFITHYILLLGDDSMLEDRKVELTALRDKLNEMGNSL